MSRKRFYNGCFGFYSVIGILQVVLIFGIVFEQWTFCRYIAHPVILKTFDSKTEIIKGLKDPVVMAKHNESYVTKKFGLNVHHLRKSQIDYGKITIMLKVFFFFLPVNLWQSNFGNLELECIVSGIIFPSGIEHQQ